jgi:hypothetical protein
VYRESASGTSTLLGKTNRIRERLTAAEANEGMCEFMSSGDVAKGAVREVDTPMRSAVIMIVTCANYLHIL